MRRRLHAIRDRLRQAYGRPRLRPHHRPVDELILTVLSQNTNDRNRDVAYMRLRERFPSWEAVRRAPEDEIEEAIRPGGISRIKAYRIQAILDDLDGDELEWMAHAPMHQAMPNRSISWPMSSSSGTSVASSDRESVAYLLGNGLPGSARRN